MSDSLHFRKHKQLFAKFIGLLSIIITTHSPVEGASINSPSGKIVGWGDAGGEWLVPEDATAMSGQIRKIITTESAFCALKTDGSVLIWGDPKAGGEAVTYQEGEDGVLHGVSKLDQLTSGIVSVAATKAAFAAVKSDGSVVSWGVVSSDSEMAISKLYGVRDIFATSASFAAVTEWGAVAAWGWHGTQGNTGGDITQYGDENYLSHDVVEVLGMHSAFAARTSEGKVYAWGKGGSSGGYINQRKRAALNSGAPVAKLFANTYAFCALKTDGSLVTWGSGDFGGYVEHSRVAANVTSGVVHVFSNSHAFAALKANGQVFTWGYPISGGMLGLYDGTTLLKSLPETLLSSGVQQVFGTRSAFAALKSDGSVVTWGSIWNGGDSSDVADALVGVSKIFATDFAFAALRSDGRIVCWGAPLLGGDCTDIDVSSGIVEVFANKRAFAALGNDGSVVTWGGASFGGTPEDSREQLSGISCVYGTASAFIAVGGFELDGCSDPGGVTFQQRAYEFSNGCEGDVNEAQQLMRKMTKNECRILGFTLGDHTGSNFYSPFSGKWASDCSGCITDGNKVGYNTHASPGCTSSWESICIDVNDVDDVTCIDDDSEDAWVSSFKCAVLAGFGWCDKTHKYADHIHRRCPFSCGTCVAPASVPAPSPVPAPASAPAPGPGEEICSTLSKKQCKKHADPECWYTKRDRCHTRAHMCKVVNEVSRIHKREKACQKAQKRGCLWANGHCSYHRSVAPASASVSPATPKHGTGDASPSTTSSVAVAAVVATSCTVAIAIVVLLIIIPPRFRRQMHLQKSGNVALEIAEAGVDASIAS